MNLTSEFVLKTWDKMKSLPAGKMLFSTLLGRLVPYTGTIKPEVLELKPGLGRFSMQDRHRIRNHLRSVHALALANLCELSMGMTLTVSLPPRSRIIITTLTIEYLKKARGTITAECRTPTFTDNNTQDIKLHTELRNELGELVARGTSVWRSGPA